MRTNLPFFGIASIVLAASLLFDALEDGGRAQEAAAAVKTTEEYTKAAARTQAAEARAALDKFKSEAAKCVTELDKIAKSATDQGCKKAVTSFHYAMKALGASARVEAQIKNLKAMEAEGRVRARGNQTQILSTTVPATSVKRKSRP